MLAHLFAYVGIPALLALAGIRLRDELFEKTETYRTFRDSPGARPSVAGAQCGNPVAERERLLSLQIPPKKSRLPGALRSGAPAKVLVFMQLFRLPPHYVMRCGPIDLVTMSPWRLR